MEQDPDGCGHGRCAGPASPGTRSTTTWRERPQSGGTAARRSRDGRPRAGAPPRTAARRRVMTPRHRERRAPATGPAGTTGSAAPGGNGYPSCSRDTADGRGWQRGARFSLSGRPANGPRGPGRVSGRSVQCVVVGLLADHRDGVRPAASDSARPTLTCLVAPAPLILRAASSRLVSLAAPLTTSLVLNLLPAGEPVAAGVAHDDLHGRRLGGGSGSDLDGGTRWTAAARAARGGRRLGGRDGTSVIAATTASARAGTGTST